MKRLSILLAAVAFAVQAWAYDFQSGGLYYNITSNTEPYTVEVTNELSDYPYYNTCPTGTLEIPATVSNGGTIYSVTNIGKYAFHECSYITSITIPESVTSISDFAFYGCSSLYTIVIPKSVKSIGEQSFLDCSYLTEITVDGNNQEYSSQDGVLFNKDKTSLLWCPEGISGTYTIPNSVTTIGNYAFRGCQQLVSIEIPNTVKEIGNSAFYYCSNIKSISIPENVTRIGEYAFSFCLKLETIEIPKGVTSIEDYTFVRCDNLETVNIPNSVTNIGYGAFADCPSLQTLSVPPSVTSIGSGAFSSGTTVLYNGNASGSPWGAGTVCIDETDFELSEDKKTLIRYTGEGGDVYIPYGVTSIGDDAFEYCYNLTSVTIPNSVTNIGSNAFYFCKNLKSVTIPNSVANIGDGAFLGCNGLKSVTIPQSVTSIGAGVFSLCSNLTDINVIYGNPFFTAEDGVLFNSNKTILICYPPGKKGSYTIPQTVTNIEWSAFNGCLNLTSVTIPNSVTYIGGFAFANCNSLTSVVIPNSVTKIENQTFGYCTKLKAAIIPESVESISESAFLNVNKQSIVYSGTATGYPWGAVDFGFGYDDFMSFTTNIDAHFDETNHCATISKVETSNTWDTGFNPPTWYGPGKNKNEPFEICFDAKYVGEGTDGDGKGQITFIQGRQFGSFYGTEDELFELCYSLGIDVVDYSWQIQGAIEQMYVDNFTDAPADFERYVLIRNVNFYPTSEWKHFSFTGNLGRHAADSVDIAMEFGTKAGTYSIRNFQFKVKGKVFAQYFMEPPTPDSDGFLFADAEKTQLVGYEGSEDAIEIPASVTSICDLAFRNCSGLKSVTIPESVTSIGTGAFYGCSGLTSVTIPSSVTSIGEAAFYGTSATIDCSFSKQPKGWSANWFGGNGTVLWQQTTIENDELIFEILDASTVKLTKFSGSGASVAIPATVTYNNAEYPVVSIADSAFFNCKNLKSVTIPNTVKSIGNAAFFNCPNINYIEIPSSVGSIGKDALFQVKIVISPSISQDNSYGALKVCSLIDDKGFIYFDSDKKNLAAYVGKGGKVSIPTSVITIGSNAFKNCASMTSVEIPYYVTRIESNAFEGCRGLTELTIPDNVTTIGKGAFMGCTKLESVTFGKSVKTINHNAFAGCGSLTEITLPTAVSAIGNSAFEGCIMLETITLGSSVNNLGRGVFYRCLSLKHIICEGNIPPMVSNELLTDGVDNDDKMYQTVKLTYPESSEYYKTQQPWCNFKKAGPQTTSVSESAATAVSIYAYGNIIVVENATDEISVYNAMGALVGREAMNRVRAELLVNGAGVYIVKVGNVVKRVMISD